MILDSSRPFRVDNVDMLDKVDMLYKVDMLAINKVKMMDTD